MLSEHQSGEDYGKDNHFQTQDRTGRQTGYVRNHIRFFQKRSLFSQLSRNFSIKRTKRNRKTRKTSEVVPVISLDVKIAFNTVNWDAIMREERFFLI